MNASDVRIVRKETAYRGFFRIERYWLRHRMHDGEWTDTIVRELFERGHSAAVLPYDPVRDEVVLVEQFRIGAVAAGVHPWLTEIVAGMMEEGETAEEIAAREAREEIGCDVTDLVKICDLMPSPGGSSETVSLFCGRVDASAASGIHGNKHEGEDILVFSLPFPEAWARLQQGGIRNSFTIIALQWLAMNRERLRRQWGTLDPERRAPMMREGDQP